jgi:homogentisate 1,2-dioxygenase
MLPVSWKTLPHPSSAMPAYLKIGSLPRKRHLAHRTGQGGDAGVPHAPCPPWPGFRGEGIYYEEVITLAGFGRAYSIAYHLRPPTRVSKVEAAGTLDLGVVDEPCLRHHHFRSGRLQPAGDPITGRVPFLSNEEVILWRCRPTDRQQELYRNADADEILFIHKGKGTLSSMYGVLPFRPHDYVVVPRCTTYRIDFDPDLPPDLLVIEAANQVLIPPRYLNADGQIRLGAPYSERDFHGPRELLTVDQEEETTVLIRDRFRLTRYTLAQHPFDVVGWDGMVYPFTFNANDFEPITGTVHQPPPIHQTFEARGFVVCTFAPRMLDTHPEAIKVPYAHSNVQADEVLYYVEGNFGSRRGVEEGSFTLHPRGIPHGPHPGTILASRDITRTDELAVMVDTIRPLSVTARSMDFDDPNYPYSWLA